MIATFLRLSLSLAVLIVTGITCASESESRKMKLPMSVMPLAVVETPRTGTPACCAAGSVASAVLLSVGPRMAITLSVLISLSNAVIPWSFFPASSSITGASWTPGIRLPALISSTASWMAFFCGLP